MTGFRAQIMLLLCLLTPPLGAQGVLTGKLFDAAGGEEYLDEAVEVGAVALPADSPPFNELTAAQWQAAFTALAERTEPTAPLGGMITPVTPTGSWFTPAEGDGSFRLEGVPLKTRLAVAAKVGELWWPLVNEAWLTSETPAQEVRIPYFRMGADRAGVRIEKYTIGAGTNLRPDLRYAPITVLETLRLSNPDPARAALITLELDLMVPPGLSAMNLPTMYGSQFMYMQGWSGAEPLQKPHDQHSAGAWSFGTGGGMHGGAASYGPGAHTSADNWHPLNDDPMLAMAGAGETVYRVNPSSGGRSATLVFTRPVPPARQGIAGVLEIRLLHQGGVLMAAPDGKVAIRRSFDYPVVEAEADLGPDLTLAALVEGAHRRLFGQSEAGNGTRFPSNPEHTPDLAALEVAQLVFGFSPEAQQAIGQLEARASGQAPPTAQAAPDNEAARFDLSMLFKALALLFGLAFVGALVATMRKPREKQLEKLAELPASRREVLDAVLALEQEYKEGTLPARAYQDQRQRLLNRLVEFDAGAAEEQR